MKTSCRGINDPKDSIRQMSHQKRIPEFNIEMIAVNNSIDYSFDLFHHSMAKMVE